MGEKLTFIDGILEILLESYFVTYFYLFDEKLDLHDKVELIIHIIVDETISAVDTLFMFILTVCTHKPYLE